MCRGGHFFSSPTLTLSVIGIYHTYMRGSVFTNSEHQDVAHKLMSRILMFVYDRLALKRPDADGMSTLFI